MNREEQTAIDVTVQNVGILRGRLDAATELMRRYIQIDEWHIDYREDVEECDKASELLRTDIRAFLASQQDEQFECGCCGQSGPCDADCDTRKHPEQAEGAQPCLASELKRREYPSKAQHPDVADFNAECAEITGWNAAVIQHERITSALRAEIEREREYRAFLQSANAGLAEKLEAQGSALHVVFDGPPGPESGRFVECETPDGRSINAGEWQQRPDGLWQLVVPGKIAAQPAAVPVAPAVQNPCGYQYLDPDGIWRTLHKEHIPEVEASGRRCRAIYAAQAAPAGQVPEASAQDRALGWTLDYRFVERVTELAGSRTEYTVSMEASEQVLLAARDLLAAAPEVES